MTKIRLLFPAVTMVVITILSLLLFKQCDKVKTLQDEAFSERNGARKVEEHQNAVISALTDTIRAIRQTRHDDSIKFVRASEGLRIRNSALSRKYAELKAEIKPMSDSVPVVKAFEHAADSLLSIKDSIILAEQRNLLVVHKSYQGEIAHLHGVIESKGKISEAWEKSAVASEKKAGKAERKNKRNRTIAIVLGGIVATIAAVSVLIVSGQ